MVPVVEVVIAINTAWVEWLPLPAVATMKLAVPPEVGNVSDRDTWPLAEVRKVVKKFTGIPSVAVNAPPP